MDDDSLNFGSDAAGATPGSNSILAQPPLQGEDASPEAGSSAQGEAQSGDSKWISTSEYTPDH
jgi:SWI/SNF related-matrix-associated actin-dependent regulator of chromatin subfamily C